MSANRERTLKVVLFSDVVGSSEKIFADELIAVQHIKSDLAMIKEVLQVHGGSLVKSLGDGILATFDGPSQALEFVEDVVTQLTRKTGYSLRHRFGIHVGEIYADGDDIIGQGVHLASRLQTIAPANGVAFVRTTYEMIDVSYRRRATLMGDVLLAGLPESVVCYAIDEAGLLGAVAGEAPASTGPEPVGLDPRFTSQRILRQAQDALSGTPYRLERPIGRSPLSRTFLVRDHGRERQAVLKLFQGEPEALAALEVEAACLDRLRHPSIPRCLDLSVRGDHLCLLQEWIPGPSLQGSLDYLRKKQRLSELLRQVLEVLDAVHRVGVIHGDIHPSNLIPSPDTRRLFLVDFSLVKSRAGSLSSDAAPSGEAVDAFSPAAREAALAQEPGDRPGGPNARAFYSPPERVRFGRIWSGVDLYALGVTALRLYTGRHPRQLYDYVLGGWTVSDLDRDVEAWLTPLLEESPGRRLKTAADALQLLDRPDSGSFSRRPIFGLAQPDPAIGAGQGPIEKARLQQTLTEIYGPVVELLLENCPSTIPAEELTVLQARLIEAGLQAEDITAAMERARPHRDEDAAAAPPTCDPGPGLADLPAIARPALLAVLSRSIGPVADLLLTPQVVLELLQPDGGLPESLRAHDLPDQAVQALLEEARLLLQGESGPEPATAALPRQTEGERDGDGGRDTPEAVASAGDDALLRQALLEAVGPVGEEIHAGIRAVSFDRRLEEAVEALTRFAVDAEVIETLRRRCGVAP